MPRYILPEKKKDDEKGTESPSAIGTSPVDWQRRVTIPVNQAILDELSIGDSATVKLTGNVIGMRDDKDANNETRTVDFEIESVEAYSMNEDNKAFASGYKEATGRDMDES